MYAIIEDSGTQIRVAPGAVLKIAKRDLKGSDQVSFDKVLYVSNDGQAKIGAPLLAGAKVTASVLGQGRTRKVRIIKFRRRKESMRRRGHRQDYIRVKIDSIVA